jgi:hypothetical protein
MGVLTVAMDLLKDSSNGFKPIGHIIVLFFVFVEILFFFFKVLVIYIYNTFIILLKKVSGRIEKVQGYEPFALNELMQKELIHEDDIFVGTHNVPTIWYCDEKLIKHRHYVDIFIKSQNRCIEVKSKKKDNIFVKQNAAKELGYKYDIFVFDCKGMIVEKYE